MASSDKALESAKNVQNKKNEDQNAKVDDKSEKAGEESPPGYFAYWKPVGALALVILAFDHLTKYLSLVYLRDSFGNSKTVEIIPNFFNLYYAENRGAAFSIADGKTGLLAIVSIVASIFIVYFFTRLPAKEKLGRFALGMIFAGAIGNFIDRAFRGFVVDMLDVYVGKYHWPTFNIADSFVCIGTGILAYLIFKGRI